MFKVLNQKTMRMMMMMMKNTEDIFAPPLGFSFKDPFFEMLLESLPKDLQQDLINLIPNNANTSSTPTPDLKCNDLEGESK